MNLVKIPGKKSMKWGRGSLKWIRPLKIFFVVWCEKNKYRSAWILFSKFYLHSDLFIEKKISIKSFSDYKKKLKELNINFDQKERKKLLKEAKITKKKGLNFI